jgi:hypothetical protein
VQCTLRELLACIRIILSQRILQGFHFEVQWVSDFDLAISAVSQCEDFFGLSICKCFKHYCHQITRNASWKLAVWFTWHRPSVIELCQQLIYDGVCNWGLFWTFIGHFCNFSLWPPHSRIMSLCVSLSIIITHNFDKEKTSLACGSRFMGHHVEYHYSNSGFLH